MQTVLHISEPFQVHNGANLSYPIYYLFQLISSYVSFYLLKNFFFIPLSKNTCG